MRLPPWGVLSQEHQSLADLSGPIPDWQGDARDYYSLFDEVRVEIANHIWPEFDTSTLKWRGDAQDFADDMTKAELRIAVEEIQKANVLTRLPDTPHYTGTNARKDHMWHFRVEDRLAPDKDGLSPFELSACGKGGANFIFYDNRVNPDSFSKAFITAGGRKIETLFCYKAIFARPRAYQAATIFGISDYKWHVANLFTHAGLHPSIISGHSLQGILMNAAVLESWLDVIDIDAVRWDTLAQYAVDFGDRRVMAGVHHLTDNIASWVLALRLIPRSFRHANKIEEFARFAITQKSLVYRIIKDNFPRHTELDRPLSLLNKYI
jgi:hypothetical protein